MDKQQIAQILVSLIICIAVFIGLNSLVQSLPLTDVPLFLQPYWLYVQQFFAKSQIIVAVTFGRNILGYLRNYYRSEIGESYDVKRLYETWMYYIGGLTTVLTVVPAPYDAMCAAVIVLLDFVTSEIGKLRES